MKYSLKITAAFLALALILTASGCGKEAGTGQKQDGPSPMDALQSTSAQPVTLEQELLKRRGKSFDQSDYQTLTGGENIIDLNTEFDSQLDYGYSTTIDCIFLSGGKIYRSNFYSPLSNGKNVQEIGTLPGAGDIVKWHLTYDGEMGSIDYRDGTHYSLRSLSPSGPYTAEQLDSETYPMFSKVYRYASDGTTLEDHTAEYLQADKVYSYGGPEIAFIGETVSLIFPGKYLDKGTTEWTWYRDMGWREYIAFDLDISAMGSETPIRLFNNNIIMTNCAFYEIIYASKPLDDNDGEAQLAPDGSVSPYYPAYNHLNCNLKLRKLELLSTYYSDVRNICTSHVITTDYKLLPITEIITEGYNEYSKYDCNRFYWDYLSDTQN